MSASSAAKNFESLPLENRVHAPLRGSSSLGRSSSDIPRYFVLSSETGGRGGRCCEYNFWRSAMSAPEVPASSLLPGVGAPCKRRAPSPVPGPTAGRLVECRICLSCTRPQSPLPRRRTRRASATSGRAQQAEERAEEIACECTPKRGGGGVYIYIYKE